MFTGLNMCNKYKIKDNQSIKESLGQISFCLTNGSREVRSLGSAGGRVGGGVKSTHHTNHFHENNLEIRQD